MIKPLAEQFQKLNPSTKLKQFGNWKINKTLNSLLLELISAESISITIEGSSEIKGTYFHPLAVLPVLEWLAPAFKQEVYNAYENYVVEQNALIHAQQNNTDLASDLTERNVQFLAPIESDEEEEADGITVVELEDELKKL